MGTSQNTGSQHCTHLDPSCSAGQSTAPPALTPHVTGPMKGSSSCSAHTPGKQETPNISTSTQPEHLLPTILTLRPQPCPPNLHGRHPTAKQTHTQPQGQGREAQQGPAAFQTGKLKQSLTELIQVTLRST